MTKTILIERDDKAPSRKGTWIASAGEGIFQRGATAYTALISLLENNEEYFNIDGYEGSHLVIVKSGLTAPRGK